MLLQFLANGIAQGSVYAIVAIGFALIYQITKVFNIAQGATYTISAYIFFTIARILNLPVILGLIIGILAGVLFVILSEKFIFIPLYTKEASPGISLISSIGLYIFVVNFIALIYGNETKILSPGIERTFTFGGIILTRIQIFEIIACFLGIPIILIFLWTSRIGKQIRGVIDNPKLANALGTDIKNIRIIACIIGGGLISIGSCLVALDVGIDPQIGIGAILNGAVGMIIGGINSLSGAAIGGLTLGIIQNLVVYQTSARWQSAITFLILIIFLVFKPEGIFGSKKRTEG
ncbi:MAG: branched-chain amino acid ABC transporter permease [candidate division WOR-3 bacterium]